MLIYYVLSFFLSLVLVYLTKRIALRFNIVDKPNHRKVHKKPKALLGGLAIYLTIVSVYSLYMNFDLTKQMIVIMILSFILLCVGLYDDLFDMRAFIKLFGQLSVAFLTSYVLGGIDKIVIYDYALNFTFIQGVILETLWIVALINAFNLIDGLDGLSSGIGIISFSLLLVVSYITGDSTNLIILLIIIGALLGFLFYNFYPSTIFLGDAGSMLIGYFLAIISISGYKSVTLTSMSLLLLIAFMPFLDVFLAIIRRKANKKKAFEADSLHFHHRLLLKGYTHSKAVLILYLIMIGYSIIAIGIQLTTSTTLKAFLIGVIVILTIFIFEKLYLLSDKYAYITKLIKKIKKV